MILHAISLRLASHDRGETNTSRQQGKTVPTSKYFKRLAWAFLTLVQALKASTAAASDPPGQRSANSATSRASRSNSASSSASVILPVATRRKFIYRLPAACAWSTPPVVQASRHIPFAYSTPHSLAPSLNEPPGLEEEEGLAKRGRREHNESCRAKPVRLKDTRDRICPMF